MQESFAAHLAAFAEFHPLLWKGPMGTSSASLVFCTFAATQVLFWIGVPPQGVLCTHAAWQYCWPVWRGMSTGLWHWLICCTVCPACCRSFTDNVTFVPSVAFQLGWLSLAAWGCGRCATAKIVWKADTAVRHLWWFLVCLYHLLGFVQHFG